MTEGILPIDPQQIVEQATSKGGGAETRALEEKFSQLMEAQPPAADAAQAHGVHGPSSISKFFVAQEHALQQTFADIKSFAAQAPSMDMQEAAARQMELQTQMAVVQLQFNSGVYVGQSSKNALQTLMKNQ